MKITLNSLELKASLKKLAPAINTKAEDVLQNVKIVYSKSNLHMTTFDIEKRIEVFMSVEGCKDSVEDVYLVPFKLLLDTVSKAKDEITLEFKETQLIVKFKGSKIKLPLATGEYPEFDSLQDGEEKILPLEGIKHYLAFAASCTSPDVSRGVLTCVNFALSGKKDTIISGTDSNRIFSYALKNTRLASFDLNIPCSAILAILFVFRACEEISFFSKKGSNLIKVSTDNVTFTTRLHQGRNFPDCRAFFETQPNYEIQVNTLELKEAISIATLVADKNALLITLNLENLDTLKVTCDSQFGESVSECKIVQSLGDNFEISLNASYLTDILSLIEVACIKFQGFDKPIILLDAFDPAVKYITMPILRRARSIK